MQEELVEYCRAKGIAVTAYSPLGSSNSPILSNPVVAKIAAKHAASPANVLVSLQANRPGVSGTPISLIALPSLQHLTSLLTVLTKSVTPERVIANFKLLDLAPEEISELADIEKTLQYRACYPWWAGHGDLGFPDCRKTGPPKA